MGELRIYTDENVDIRIVDGLRRRGISAFSALEEGKIGVEDEEHFLHASKLKAVIFTHDHHFIEIANGLIQKGKKHYGVIFSEMHRIKIGDCVKRLSVYAELLSTND